MSRKHTYRGLTLPDHLAKLARHIPSLEELTDELRDLQNTWNNLGLLGDLTNIGADITQTRKQFQDLAADLSESLIQQSLHRVVLELGTKAQNTIDVLVRNLFERTADVGFLAIDSELASHCMTLKAGTGNLPTIEEAVKRRLRDYVEKYSVYENILLLDTDGQLLVDLAGRFPTGHQFKWLTDKIRTSSGYMEFFGKLEQTHGAHPALVYGWRMELEGRLAGYVVLHFNLHEESHALFDRILPEDDENSWLISGAIDEDGRVVFSSDESSIRPRQKLQLTQGKDWCITRIGPVTYLGCLRDTVGYQGYGGPGWKGFSIIPLAEAFDFEHQSDLIDGASKTEKLPQAELDYPSSTQVRQNHQTSKQSQLPAYKAPRVRWESAQGLIDPKILEIQRKAQDIQKQLNRSVWNGNIAQRKGSQALGLAFTKTLLWEISKAGERTKTLFNEFIEELKNTVAERLVKEQKFASMLAVDLMDRNLYERANDCRWWALTSAYENALDAGADNQAIKAAQDTLRHTNSLYTVYTDILLINREGVVIANSGEMDRKGQTIHSDWLSRAFDLRDQNDYAVSAHEPSDLYGGRPTYIYCSPVYDNRHAPKRAIGAIAAVFNGEPQFEAILDESSQSQNRALAYLIDQQHRVISANTEQFIDNGVLKIPGLSAETAFTPKASRSELLEIAGEVYALGWSNSGNYREYKSADCCYQNNVSCLYLTKIGPVDPDVAKPVQTQVDKSIQSKSMENALEVGTFRIGDSWYGLPATAIEGAVVLQSLARMHNSPPWTLGTMMLHGDPLTVIRLDGLLGLHTATPGSEDCNQVVLINSGETGRHFGIVVQELGGIPSFPDSDLHSTADFTSETPLVELVAKSNKGLLSILSHQKLASLLGASCQIA